MEKGFIPKSVHVGFVVDRVALGQVFLRVLLAFPYQYHSTAAPHSLINHLGGGKRAC
jgi:hypothetical protein